MDNRKKILWISYIFPPYGGKEGQREAWTLREVTRHQVEVDVLTIRPCPSFPEMDRSLLKVLPESLRIHRTSPGLLSRFRYSKRINRQIRSALNFWSNVEWAPVAIRALSRLGRQKYDGIYSLGDPITCHLVAAAAKRRFGGRLLLEYGDPYALKPPRTKVSPPRLRLQRLLESWCLKHADAVAMRVDANAEAYRRIFPFLANTQFVTIYGGIDQETYDRVAAEPPEEFVITYTGKLYDHLVGMKECLNAVARLQGEGCRIRLRFVGTTRAELKRYVDAELLDKADFVPFQAADSVIRMQKSSTILLAFGCSYPYAIPSKVSEYLACRRPTLCIEDPSCQISGLVKEYRRGVSVAPDADEIAKTIGVLYRAWCRKNLEEQFELGGTVTAITWRHHAELILRALGCFSLEVGSGAGQE